MEKIAFGIIAITVAFIAVLLAAKTEDVPPIYRPQLLLVY